MSTLLKSTYLVKMLVFQFSGRGLPGIHEALGSSTMYVQNIVQKIGQPSDSVGKDACSSIIFLNFRFVGSVSWKPGGERRV